MAKDLVRVDSEAIKESMNKLISVTEDMIENAKALDAKIQEADEATRGESKVVAAVKEKAGLVKNNVNFVDAAVKDLAAVIHKFEEQVKTADDATAIRNTEIE